MWARDLLPTTRLGGSARCIGRAACPTSDQSSERSVSARPDRDLRGGPMPFVPPRTPMSPRPSRSTGPVLSVGRRVFVNCSGGSNRRVTLTDDIGQTALGTLTDGIEVEVIAWKPRGGGTRYRVKHHKDGLEGWLSVDELRVTPRPASATPPPAATPPAAAAAAAARPTPARAAPARPAPARPAPARPAPAPARTAPARPAPARTAPARPVAAAARAKPRPAPPAPSSSRAKAAGGRKVGARAR